MKDCAKPLRFGIMCNGTIFSAWQAGCIEDILSLDGVILDLLIIDAQRNQKNWRNTIMKITSRLDRSLFYIYMKLFLGQNSKSLKKIDLTGRIKNIPRIECSVTKKGKYSEYFSEDDIRVIKSYNLDFILRFGFGIIRGEILNSARYGIWSFHHNDEEKYRGGPPCFWEIYNNDAIYGAVLQKINEKLDAGIILKKGYYKMNKISYKSNIDAILLKTAKWPSCVIRDIQNNNAYYLNNFPSPTNAGIYSIPKNHHMILYFFKWVHNNMQFFFDGILKAPFWNIGYIDKPIHTLFDNGFDQDIQWFPFVENVRFLADPFGIYKNGEYFIFCEEFEYKKFLGDISLFKFDGSQWTKGVKIINNSNIHMSYPFSFEHEKESYFIPETHQAREITLYRAVEFPEKWEKTAVIRDNIAAVDSTVIYYNGRWWLFYTDLDWGYDDNLFIMYSDQLSGPWKPHAKNPVKIDIRSSRCAGTPFIHDGNLYRPAMDVSVAKKFQVVLNKIIELTPEKFLEEKVGTLSPNAESLYSDGFHTVSSIGNKTFIDGVKYKFIWDYINQKLS